MSGINGVTVGTPTSPRRMKEEIKPVLTVNSLPPDENGNVMVRGGTGGEGGVTFYPSVSADGVLSWTNDGDLNNPAPVDISGPQGQRGAGFLRASIEPEFKAVTEGGFLTYYRCALADIKQSTKVDEVLVGDTVRYSSYLYPVWRVDDTYAYLGSMSSIRGTAGTAGKDGADGVDGKDGVGISRMGYAPSEVDGGYNVLTIVLDSGAGSELRIRNGSKGSDGYTPVKGTDYFTPEDKAELVNAVMANFTDVSKEGQ